MSNYGWLTESTLIPDKPKKIEGVQNRVAVDQLKALINNKRKNILNSNIGDIGKTGETNKIKKNNLYKIDSVATSKNRGIEDRIYKDKLSRNTEERRNIICTRKAEYYDKIRNGEVTVHNDSALATQNSDYRAPKGILIAPPVSFGGVLDEDDRNLDIEKDAVESISFDNDIITELHRSMIEREAVKKIENASAAKYTPCETTQSYVQKRLSLLKKCTKKE